MRLTTAAVFLAAVAFVSPFSLAAPPVSSAPSDADRILTSLLEQDFEDQLRANPVEASSRGYRQYDELLPDVTAAGREKRSEDARLRLEAVQAINCDDLSAASRVNYALLRYELQRRVQREQFHEWEMPISQVEGPQTSLPQMPQSLSFPTRESLVHFLERLRAIPAHIDANIANMRDGIEARRVPPKVVMNGAVDQSLAQGDARYEADPTSHLLYQPFAGRDPELSDEAKKVIATKVAPAFRKLGEFLRDEYIPACRDTIACADFPQGEDYYNFQIEGYTTLPFTAKQIHDIGLKEVARIRSEMMDTIARSDFLKRSDLKGEELFRAFTEYLRTDPRFYYTSADDLLDGYRAIAKRIDAELPRLFGKLPRLPYGVREMPAFIAASSPTAFYYNGSLKNGVAGNFIANTWRLDQRPKYEMIPLTLHEACPGHHLQIALAQELADAGLPEWRTGVGYTVFVEGWGLYSESLGLDMGDQPAPSGHGFFEDPYDDFGRHSYEMWRAMRLVVDTGMHAFNWSRDRAISFMLDNSALTRTNIEREVDRYIAWPGQAVAYKIGELHIKMLRKKAQEALGPNFDIRGFHDAVLGQGAVPLDEMTRQIDAWIASKQAD